MNEPQSHSMTQSLICANSIFRRTTAPEFPHLNVRCPLPLIGCPRVTLRITRRPTRTEAAEITVKRATPVLRPLSSSDVSIARIVHQLFPFYGSVRSSFLTVNCLRRDGVFGSRKMGCYAK